ncbi:TolB family protein [Nonomuraea sp. NPDC050451]|uniref:TolB family protein n=1 Tax=Nonomuraea sp. NPDC050451 TaxID=3364364 RepID=UPI0037B2335C
MTEVEETLRRTLGQAAEQAPGLPALLPQRLERIHRRRRQRARIALAAAAVVLVGSGATAFLRGGDTITAVPAAGPDVEAPAEQVEKVWPEAVRKVSAKAPDGAPWRPETFIDDRTLLMGAQGGRSGTTDAVYAYDLDSGTPRKIADVPAPEGTVGSNGFAVGGGQVVWWTGRKDSVAQLWTVPVDGGTPKIVADQRLDPADDGSGIDELAVVNDKIVFSLYTGGVFTVPLGGGTVEPVQGGAGMHLLAWPWIGTPGRGGEPHGMPYARIQNVETGETRTAVTKPGEELRLCGVTICLGRTADGTTFFRHRDGSSQKDVPGSVNSAYQPVQDRFYVSVYGSAGKPTEGVGLYDLDTGKSGDLRIPGEGNSIMLPSMESTGRMFSYTLGDDLYLIDLSKIR